MNTVREDPWPSLRAYILGRGGLGRGDWSPSLIPGALYRKSGTAPDLIAAEAPHECPAAFGLWDPEDGSEAMLAALLRAWDCHRRCRSKRPALEAHAAPLPRNPAIPTDPWLPPLAPARTVSEALRAYIAGLEETGDPHCRAAAAVVGTVYLGLENAVPAFKAAATRARRAA